MKRLLAFSFQPPARWRNIILRTAPIPAWFRTQDQQSVRRPQRLSVDLIIAEAAFLGSLILPAKKYIVKKVNGLGPVVQN